MDRRAYELIAEHLKDWDIQAAYQRTVTVVGECLAQQKASGIAWADDAKGRALGLLLHAEKVCHEEALAMNRRFVDEHCPGCGAGVTAPCRYCIEDTRA